MTHKSQEKGYFLGGMIERGTRGSFYDLDNVIFLGVVDTSVLSLLLLFKLYMLYKLLCMYNIFHNKTNKGGKE